MANTKTKLVSNYQLYPVPKKKLPFLIQIPVHYLSRNTDFHVVPGEKYKKLFFDKFYKLFLENFKYLSFLKLCCPKWADRCVFINFSLVHNKKKNKIRQ